jgi:nitroreductase
MRRLKPDPVPDALIRQILEAGVCAANGGNFQRWRFMVVTDPAVKKSVQAWYKKAFDEVVGPRYASSPPPPGVTAPSRFSWPKAETSPSVQLVASSIRMRLTRS